MAKFINLTGNRYGRLTVIERHENSNGKSARWRCRCDCGKYVVAFASNLKRNNTSSCGCLRLEKTRERSITHGHSLNGRQTPTLLLWRHIIKRCTDPRSPGWKLYGQRGVMVCQEWMKFDTFLSDMGERPEGVTLLLIDGRKPYQKDNCWWGPERLQQGKYSTHGHSKDGAQTPEYQAWSNMHRRCGDPSNARYASYGGRGITVEPRWKSFEVFLFDMGLRPSPRLTLERIDVDRGYGPDNCRWATFKQQARNKTNNRWIEANGEKLLLVEWAERLGTSHAVILKRISRGWPEDLAVTTPIGSRS